MSLNVNASGHPFHIQTSSYAYNSSNLYTTWSNKCWKAVGVIKFEVPFMMHQTHYIMFVRIIQTWLEQ